MQQRLNTNTPIEHAVLYTSCLLFGFKVVAALQSLAPTGSGGLRAVERLYFLTCAILGVHNDSEATLWRTDVYF